MLKKTIVRIASLLLFLSIISCFILPVSAFEIEGLPDTTNANCVYFYNLDAKKVITKKGGGTKISPASSTKIMTGLIACESLYARLDETVTITKEMISPNKGTSMRLSVGDTLSIRSLLYASICGGFNDATLALAHICAGSHKKFVSLMNERATELGALNTKYANPTGFDASDQYTTLEDVILISKTAIENELYMEISSTKSKNIEFLTPQKAVTVHNRNGLIGSYYAEGYVNKCAQGLIAGMTDLGGHCVITKAVVNNSNYLCIVMGGKEIGEKLSSYTIANDLISYASNHLGFQTLMKEGELICTIPIDFALDGTKSTEQGDVLNVRTSKDVIAFIPKSIETARLSYRYYLYSERLTAPITPGTVVGALDFYLDGEYLTSVPLTVNSNVTENTFLSGMEAMKKAVIGRTTLLILAFLIIFSLIQFLLTRNRKRKQVREIKLKRYKKTQG